jgi:hypothetical protein
MACGTLLRAHGAVAGMGRFSGKGRLAMSSYMDRRAPDEAENEHAQRRPCAAAACTEPGGSDQANPCQQDEASVQATSGGAVLEAAFRRAHAK